MEEAGVSKMATFNFEDILAAQPPAVQRAIDARFRELVSAYPLADLRCAAELTQGDVAARMEISQAAVSKMEARDDVLLSTLFRYVQAVGGKARFSIELGDREFEICQAEESASQAFRLRSQSRTGFTPDDVYANTVHRVRAGSAAKVFGALNDAWNHGHSTLRAGWMNADAPASIADNDVCYASSVELGLAA